MNRDVIINKVETIERCVKRIKEVYDDNSSTLDDLTKQDSIILNIQRACESAIDISMHIVAMKNLGVPQTSREAFELLEKTNLLSPPISKNMKSMVGFRNIAIHDYQKINIKIVQSIIEEHLKDFTNFTTEILKQLD